MFWDCKSFTVLLCLCLFYTSSYALINLPGPLEWVIIRVLSIDVYRYGVIVSLCSWTSLLDIVHGYLLDRYLGLTFATWLYVSLTIIGNVLYCIAGFTRSYWLIILGRTVFGLGVNPLILLSNKHIINWFGKGKYVNAIYSLCESIFWLGSAIIYFCSVHVLDAFKIIYDENEAFAITNLIENVIFTILTVLPIIICVFMYKYIKADDNSKVPDDISSVKEEVKTEKKMGFKDYVCLPAIFWVFSITVFLFYVSILSFISMSLLFFVSQYNVSSGYSSTLSGLITLMPSVLSPFFGLILDKIGHNLSALTLAVMLNGLAQGLIAFTMCNPLIPVILLGLSLVLSSGLWSQFQFLVEEHQYMIAYGVAQTGLNGAQAVGTLIAGYVIDTYGYNGFTIFQFVITISAVPVIAAVWMLDYRRDFFLNMTGKAKNTLLGRLKENSSKTEKIKGEVNEGFSNERCDTTMK